VVRLQVDNVPATGSQYHRRPGITYVVQKEQSRGTWKGRHSAMAQRMASQPQGRPMEGRQGEVGRSKCRPV